MKQRIALGGALAASTMLCVGRASATDAMRFPDNGTEQMARGGAWVARASNPLATLYNPGALPTQRTGALLDVNAVFFKECYQRAGTGSTVQVGTSTPTYPETCNSNSNTPQPLPSAAFVWRATDKLGVGISVSPPSLYGHTSFPETVPVTYTNLAGLTRTSEVASPQRYMMLNIDGVLLNTTISAGYSITDRIHVGAGFIWGFGYLKVTSATMSLPSDTQTIDNPQADLWAHIDASDWFIPGVVVGALVTPIDQLDIAASVTAQEAFESHGDLTLEANYWTGKPSGDPISNTPAETKSPGTAHFKLPNPLDVRLGARLHLPRSGSHAAASGKQVRDPLVGDIFDFEVDGSYTRNSVYKSIYLRFPDQPPIPVNGVSGGVVPPNGDVAMNLTGDTIGVRVGGDYVVLPGRFAVRAGAWFEPSAQHPQDLNVTVVASQRIGLSGGLTYRLGKVDLEGGYMHVFFATQDNGGNGNIRALSGNAAAKPVAYRSPYPINGGRLTAHANIVSLGATMRF